MKVTGEPHSSATLSASEALVPSTGADPKAFHRATTLPKRKARNLSLTRRRRSRTPAGRLNRPETPLLKWNLEDIGRERNVAVEDEDGCGHDHAERETTRLRGSRNSGRQVSARKLASGLWRLQVSDMVAGAGERRSRDRLGFQAGSSYLDVQFLHRHSVKRYCHERSNPRESPVSVATKDFLLCKLEPTIPFSNSAMEGATKWDPICLERMDEAQQIYSHMKRADKQVNAVSLVSSLEVQLEEARARIGELEIGKRSQKKKLEQFMRKVGEERAAWQSREHQKIRAFIDDMKLDLNLETKARQRLGIVNSKLISELADAKLAAKQYMKEYEKERKARELIEEACDELVKEIGEDKAEVEALKRESMKLRKEAEDERKMLQMAEVWREERVQMKLVDVKVMLEEKYSQMNKLVADLEAFLRSRSATTTDAKEIRDGEQLLKAAGSVDVQDVKGFTYEPPNPDDICSVFEDMDFGGANGREIEPCVAYGPAGDASNVHTLSPEINMINKDRHSNIFIDQNCDIEEDESGWETVSHVEEQGSSYSPEGSLRSVNKNSFISNVSMSGTEWDETPESEISEVCSVPRRQSKKASSIAKLWKSNPSNGQNYKISMEGMNYNRASNDRKSNASIVSMDRGSGKDGFSPSDLVGQWSSPDSANPRMTQGIKGCIDWPGGAQKNSLKAKLLEARIESQKVQIRHVLKEKI